MTTRFGSFSMVVVPRACVTVTGNASAAGRVVVVAAPPDCAAVDVVSPSSSEPQAARAHGHEDQGEGEGSAHGRSP